MSQTPNTDHEPRNPIQSPKSKILQKQPWYRRREIEMKSIIKRTRGIDYNSLRIGMIRLNEIHGWNIMDRFLILVNKEVKGNTVFSQSLDMDQWGQYILTKFVINQDLVNLFICSSSGIHRLVQIQHSDNTFCKTQRKIKTKTHTKIKAPKWQIKSNNPVKKKPDKTRSKVRILFLFFKKCWVCARFYGFRFKK